MAIHKKKPLFPFNTISEALQWWRNSDDSDSSVLTQYKTIHNHIHFNRLNCQNKILLTIFDWQFFRINFRCGNKNWARSSFEFIWVEIFRQAIILCLKIPWMNNWIESEHVCLSSHLSMRFFAGNSNWLQSDSHNIYIWLQCLLRSNLGKYSVCVQCAMCIRQLLATIQNTLNSCRIHTHTHNNTPSSGIYKQF